MARALEFLLLFFALPTVFGYARHRIPAIPALWVLMAICLFFLLRDPRFDRQRLWDVAAIQPNASAILGPFALAVAIGLVLVRRVTVLYPVFSVYPQGIIYRLFIFDRYRVLFRPGWAIVLASAAAFAYVHIIFRNRLALGLSFLGGLLFALRYLQTGSLLVSWFEHALYGCAIFTIGLGRSFYHVSPRDALPRRKGSLDLL